MLIPLFENDVYPDLDNARAPTGAVMCETRIWLAGYAVEWGVLIIEIRDLLAAYRARYRCG